MFLSKYYTTENGKVVFSRQQASDFAKQVADDFNPLHDIDAKKFCVPGDLLFSLVLANSGLHKNMSFKFSGMVTNDLPLNFPRDIDVSASVLDDKDKAYMHISVEGEKTTDIKAIESLVRSYVEFSGHTFPHILVKLMAENNVMINPARPMVMYENMSINLTTLDFESVKLVESNSTLTIDGKRGNACLEFDLIAGDKLVGHGEKHMLLSGLRAYCQETIDQIVESYNVKKSDYIAS